jgi:putative transcription factor
MSTCEMCGYSGNLKRAIVEGSILDVCNKCVAYGEAIEIKKPDEKMVEQKLTFMNQRRSLPHVNAEDELLVSNYHQVVKVARSRLGKKQEEVARDLAIRESILQKVESGSMEPTIKLAKKLEQYFKIKIVKKQDKVSGNVVKEFNVRDSAVTIGDLIKFKK